jgi:alkylhydroperoxidase family enzyme
MVTGTGQIAIRDGVTMMTLDQDQPARERRLGVPLCASDSEPLLGVEQRGGQVSHLYRCLANQPVLLKAWTDFAWTLRADCETPRALRELLILRAAQLTSSQYLWDDHISFAREAGLADAQIHALSSWQSSDRFDVRERVALELVEQLVVTGRVSDASLAALESHFAAAQTVELVLTVGFYTMVPRVLDALRVPLMPSRKVDLPLHS